MVATVQFRAASALDIQASSTTTSVTVPASVAVGDYLVLHVIHRDTLTTPSGWTVLEGPTTPVEASQQQTVLVRTAQSGDAGTTVTSTQATSQRMLSHVQAFYSPDGQQVIASDIASSELAGLDLPALTATYPGQVAVVSMGNVFAQSPGTETITPPTGYTQTTPSTIEGNRLGAAYKTLGDTETISGRFEIQSADDDRTAFSLILGALLSRTEPAGTLVTLEQEVISGTRYPAQTLVTVRQTVLKDYIRYPAASLVTLDQAVVYIASHPASSLVTLSQEVKRQESAESLVSLRQAVLSPAQAATNQTRVYLDGVDISDDCSPAITITGSEGDNRVAQVVYRPPSGALSIPSYQGRSVEIVRLIDGDLVPLFTGKVDLPRYDRYARTLSLRCLDMRNRRIGQEDQARLKAMTGGLISDITQRADEAGEAWVRELMKTVEGSLDYTGAGVLRYTPWAVTTPRYTLGPAKVHYKEAESEFATNSEIVNTISATIEYRYFQRYQIDYSASLSVPTSQYCKLAGCTPASSIIDEDGNRVSQIVPTRAALRQAVESVSGWLPSSFAHIPLPPDGWYRGSDGISKIRYLASGLIRQTRAMGADFTLSRYISQPTRETYRLTVEAPESVDQYGEIQGNAMRFAAETRVDPSIYESRGCTIVADPDDRRADVELAIQCAQRMAAKQIRAGHRGNTQRFRYKPARGEVGYGEILPVEIGDTLDLSSSEMSAVGYVTEFSHVLTREGDIYTDVALAVSRVESAVSVTEDWSLPAAPGDFKLTPAPAGQLETPDCPAPIEADADDDPGETRINPDGSVVIVTPRIERDQVDEIVGTRATTYPVAIPVDPISVVVP